MPRGIGYDAIAPDGTFLGNFKTPGQAQAAVMRHMRSKMDMKSKKRGSDPFNFEFGFG